MIAADQKSRVHGGMTLDAVEAKSCEGCFLLNGARCSTSSGAPKCMPFDRLDDKSIIWVARKPTEISATASDDAEVRRIAEAACKTAAQEPGDYIRGDVARRREELPTDPRLITGTGSKDDQCADKLDAFSIIFDDPAYASLGRVLTRAYAQAATGKGAERHGQGQPFERQPMQDLIRLHGAGFATGQASKKSQEALRLPRGRAVAELLGAMNYLAGAIIAIEAGDTHHKD